MTAAATRERANQSASSQVRSRIHRGGERLWRHADFANLPPQAVSQALSRLTRDGELQRVAKGVYYRPRPTVVGPSRPAPDQVAAKATALLLQPAGLSAAHWLGFTSQNPAVPEYVSSASWASTRLSHARIRTRRRQNRDRLDTTAAALLELLRDRGETSDLDNDATCRRLLDLLATLPFDRLAKAALGEPPRVRAILGAAGQQTGGDERSVKLLRDSLNPLSRFEFGKLDCLAHSREWQAK